MTDTENFIVYSTHSSRKYEPFRIVSKLALRKYLINSETYKYFLMKEKRTELLCMYKCDNSDIENLFLFMQCEKGQGKSERENDTRMFNDLYNNKLCSDLKSRVKERIDFYLALVPEWGNTSRASYHPHEKRSWLKKRLKLQKSLPEEELKVLTRADFI